MPEVQVRKAVEMHAMNLATALSEAKDFGYRTFRVQDISGNASYDLLCINSDDGWRVEVTGITGAGKRVFLTANEVAHARDRSRDVALSVVASIEPPERFIRQALHRVSFSSR